MRHLLTTLLITSLTACGGGGSGGSTASTTATPTFPLLQAVKSINTNGNSGTLTAIGTAATKATDGDCSGTLTGADVPTKTTTTFRGQTAYASTSTFTMNLTNCTPASSSGTSTYYYDANYLDLGHVSSTGKMSLWLTPPSIPASVKVGDTFVVGTEYDYTDTTGNLGDGRTDYTVVMEADTSSSTAIVNKVGKHYDASGQLTYTSQSRMRVDAAGTLTIVSVDNQYAAPSNMRLVFRR